MSRQKCICNCNAFIIESSMAFWSLVNGCANCYRFISIYLSSFRNHLSLKFNHLHFIFLIECGKNRVTPYEFSSFFWHGLLFNRYRHLLVCSLCVCVCFFRLVYLHIESRFSYKFDGFSFENKYYCTISKLFCVWEESAHTLNSHWMDTFELKSTFCCVNNTIHIHHFSGVLICFRYAFFPRFFCIRNHHLWNWCWTLLKDLYLKWLLNGVFILSHTRRENLR